MSGANFRLGFECTLYLNTGTYASPTWVEVDVVKNAALVVENAVADVSMRRGKGWASEMNALSRLPIEVEALYEKGNTSIEKFIEAAISKRIFLDLLILDGPREVPSGGTAAKGIRAWFNVSNYNQGQELENAVMVTFTLGAAPFPATQEPKEFTGTVLPP